MVRVSQASSGHFQAVISGSYPCLWLGRRGQNLPSFCWKWFRTSQLSRKTRPKPSADQLWLPILQGTHQSSLDKICLRVWKCCVIFRQTALSHSCVKLRARQRCPGEAFCKTSPLPRPTPVSWFPAYFGLNWPRFGLSFRSRCSYKQWAGTNSRARNGGREGHVGA